MHFAFFVSLNLNEKISDIKVGGYFLIQKLNNTCHKEMDPIAGKGSIAGKI